MTEQSKKHLVDNTARLFFFLCALLGSTGLGSGSTIGSRLRSGLDGWFWLLFPLPGANVIKLITSVIYKCS
jgi:hypothetical protein